MKLSYLCAINVICTYRFISESDGVMFHTMFEWKQLSYFMSYFIRLQPIILCRHRSCPPRQLWPWPNCSIQRVGKTSGEKLQLRFQSLYTNLVHIVSVITASSLAYACLDLGITFPSPSWSVCPSVTPFVHLFACQTVCLPASTGDKWNLPWILVNKYFRDQSRKYYTKAMLRWGLFW